MFTKLLLTITVIIAVLLLARTRRAGKPVPQRAANTDNRHPAMSPARLSAWILIAVIATITLTVTAYHFLGARDTVTIRVINSNTGNAVSYQAYRAQTGQRSFSTVDGRTITLAEVERMETGPAEDE